MSTVRLITFALYKSAALRPKSADEVEIIAGASQAKIVKDGKLELVIASCPMQSAQLVPKTPVDGILMLYGIRDTTLELQRMRNEARRLNAEFAFADVEVEIGDIEVGLVDRALLDKKTLRFLNVRRMKSSLQADVLKKFSEFAKSENQDIDGSMERVSQIATRPDLWDKLFANDPGFKNLEVLVIPVADDPHVLGAMRSLAYVRRNAKITKIVQGSDHVSLAMPEALKTEPPTKPVD
jgi:hypothetical protein